MRQRVVAIFGLAGSPRWLVADEPTKGMDAILRGQVYQLLERITESGEQGMLMITRDIAFARSLCRRIAVLYRGQIVEEGESGAVVHSPRHPYTQALLESLPSRGMKPMPPGGEPPPGACRFAPRCRRCTGGCLSTSPPLVAVSCGTADKRKVRCLYP